MGARPALLLDLAPVALELEAVAAAAEARFVVDLELETSSAAEHSVAEPPAGGFAALAVADLD